ncbi:MAG TPA: hypothetical protein VFX16_23170 [Pseudonocardiaceae bacterium]|nr:hypothetical protein [Pseudonocardiaceae bacterium]
MVVVMFVGRLPNGLFPLGIVFVLRRSSGSYAVAGPALADARHDVRCPVRGRTVDRWGQSRTLVSFVAAQSVVMTGFLLAVRGTAAGAGRRRGRGHRRVTVC